NLSASRATEARWLHGAIIAALAASALSARGLGVISRPSMTPLRRNPSNSRPAGHMSHAPLGRADVRNIFYGLMLGMFLSALNQTIVATALPTIGRDFGNFDNLSWVIIAYLLSSTVVSPLYGKLSDIHGRRAMMLVALGLFVAGSVVS